MLTPTSDLLARAKAYVDADDVDVGGWLNDSLWYSWMNQENRNLYRTFLRNGLMGPKFVDQTITANGSDSYILATEPLAIAGVAEMVFGGPYPRPLQPMQVLRGRYPWGVEGAIVGSATHWAAYYEADGTVSVGLQPIPQSGTYTVRTVPQPLTLVATVSDPTTQTNQVSYPPGTEERIALGMAERAYEREGVMSPTLTRLIQRADEEMARAAAELLEGQAPKVRNVDYEYRGWRRRGQDMAPVMWTAAPQLWWWAP